MGKSIAVLFCGFLFMGVAHADQMLNCSEQSQSGDTIETWQVTYSPDGQSVEISGKSDAFGTPIQNLKCARYVLMGGIEESFSCDKPVLTEKEDGKTFESYLRLEYFPNGSYVQSHKTTVQLPERIVTAQDDSFGGAECK